MAQDRFVRFKGKAPSHDEVQKILENYFGGCGSIEERRPLWWFVTLPGQATAPFESIEGAWPLPCEEDRTRWIEVQYTEASLDVLTRRQDEFTNGIADQLARALARFYSAKLEMG